MNKNINYSQILESLTSKAATKQAVYKNTLSVMQHVKKIFSELEKNLLSDYKNSKLANVEISYKENNDFEAEIKLGGDVIVVSMHSNIFTFEEPHGVNQSKMVAEDPMNAYFGKINIYNFLADSVKYNRSMDSGWRVARVFINKSNHFFVEGSGQLGFLFSALDEQVMQKDILSVILEIAILQSLDSDLVAEPFNINNVVTLGEKQQMFANAGVSVSKHIGYKFQAETKA